MYLIHMLAYFYFYLIRNSTASTVIYNGKIVSAIKKSIIRSLCNESIGGLNNEHSNRITVKPFFRKSCSDKVLFRRIFFVSILVLLVNQVD